MAKENLPKAVPSSITQKQTKDMEVPLREKTYDEILAEHESLLLKKAEEMRILEEKCEQIIKDKNRPIYLLSNFLFSNFCSDPKSIARWKTEGEDWNEELHKVWFNVGEDVYNFIKTNKEELRL